MEGSKSVLVCIAEHRRVVCFSGDLNNLKIKVKEAFGDMIPDCANFFFQVKTRGVGRSVCRHRVREGHLS